MRREDVKHEFVRYTRGYGLDLGHGKETAFPHFLGVREKGDSGACPPNLVVDSFQRLDMIEDEKCDFIMVAGVKEWAIAEWLRCIRDGGCLCLYDPDAKTARDVERFGGQNITPIRTGVWSEGGAFCIVRKGKWEPKERRKKTACVVRHGGIGDMLQAAYLLPQLKRDGYHVTMLSTEKGRNILSADPNVDEWFLIDDGQVPNIPGRNELAAFWQVTARHFAKFVNLSESVEGTFLAVPGRTPHAWPLALRQKMLDHNYAEFAAALAEIRFVPEGRFYPTPDEMTRAQERVVEMRAPLARPLERADPVFLIMWVLAGSSPHKFSPHQDTVIKMIMGTLKRAVIVLVGDFACKILESGWEAEPRVICASGELDIRATLALAQRMDLVIGPETGVMNAICYEDIAKVVMLSHSSHENLTKHWKHAYPIAGRSPCYPCHQLHYTAEFCPQAENGAALCQDGVDPMLLFAPIVSEYEGWAKVHMLRAA